ncbi:MAG TPA: UDP-N-acetylglucosamine 2-epimerase (non-hydrolyzing) [Candidatus Nanoarchaeia archaeon]|nr:UDP-N-acetylglucosamine 2-epimerase (non-hydrolyzing) [Candidatus Nanoarchaeia archaeon]
MKLITILGTRPEIIKLSPVIPLFDKEFNHIIIHTGQHYDYNMDRIFFEQLKLRDPDYNLEIGSGSQAEQTGKMMIKIEEILIKEKPDAVLVFADPNTPLAGALAAAKLHIPVIHFEAGCRSFNKKMPEEINRIVADHCADLLLAPDKTAYDNLINEGIDNKKINIVGDVVFDATVRNKELAKNFSVLDKLNLVSERYVLVTIHRAENTDNQENLQGMIEFVNYLSRKIKVVFPVHPRTNKTLENLRLKLDKDVVVITPQGYLEFINLIENSRFVVSDSGGVQEETVIFNKCCIVARNETEWTRLTDIGKNILATNRKDNLIKFATLLLDDNELNRIKNIPFEHDKDVAVKVLNAVKYFCENELKK